MWAKEPEKYLLFHGPIFCVMHCLTHWGQVTHICIGKLTIIGSDNGSLPSRHQAIIWANAGILLIGPLGTNFSQMLIEIPTFPLKKMCLKVLSAKWRPFCLSLKSVNSLKPKHFEILPFGRHWLFHDDILQSLLLTLLLMTWQCNESGHLQLDTYTA